MADEHHKDFPKFLFLGNPLLDIVTQCDRATLDSYGLRSDDCIRETGKQESLFRSLLDNPESRFSAGGSAQNTARITRWILGQDRGIVSFAGCVGRDDFAVTMRDCLRSEGVESLYVTLDGQRTGICACLLNSEEVCGSMCARLGAAENFSKRHLAEEQGIRERSRTADCVFVEGYLFSHSPDVMLALAKECTHKQIFSISLSAEYICRDHVEVLLRVLPRVDVLFSNEAEAKVVAESLGLGDVSVEDVTRALATQDRPTTRQPRIVLVTRGPKPVLVVRGNEPPCTFPVPPDVQVIDSVGCGDALAGAFLAVYLLTGDISQAVETGIAAAVEIAQVSGCSPTKKKLYPMVEDQH